MSFLHFLKCFKAFLYYTHLVGRLLWEKTCIQNKSKFITEDQIVEHMNITIR